MSARELAEKFFGHVEAGETNQEKQVELDQAWMLTFTPDDRISAVIAYWEMLANAAKDARASMIQG